MKREYLQEEIFRLTATEEYRKNHPEDRRSRFYDLLDQQNRKDEQGYYHLPYEKVLNVPDREPANFTERINMSSCQDDFFLKKASRYSDEPFCYGDFLCIRYVYSGQDEIRTPEGSFLMKKNDVCLMNAQFVFSQYLGHEDDIVFSLMFEKEYLVNSILRHQNQTSIVLQFIYNYVLNSQNRQNYILFHGGENDRLPRIFEDMVYEFAYPSPDSKALLESYLRILLIDMSRSEYEYEKNAESKKDFLISVVINSIEENYRTITLEELAERMGYHPDYISRCMKKATGYSFKDYLLQVRMNHAENLLKNSDLSVSEIALRVGYTNETYFYKKFRDRNGCTPAEWGQLLYRQSD